MPTSDLAVNHPDGGMVVVIGLGRFGTSLAAALARRGADVMAVDIGDAVVRRLAGGWPHLVCADGTDPGALQQAGVATAAHAVIAQLAGRDAGVVAAVKAGDRIRVYRPGDRLKPGEMVIIGGRPEPVARSVQGGA